MATPAFSDIAKAANDLLNKDFYHTSASALEVKSTAPNGVVFNVKGKSSHEGATSGSLEGKYHDQATGVVLTETWTTANSLDTKIELDNQIAKGLKVEQLINYGPAGKSFGAKTNIYFKQPKFHGRAFIDALKGPTATVDLTVGHEGFLAGGEVAYDVAKAAVTRYSAAAGYQLPGVYSAAVQATNNLSVFSASYYHKVNSQIEAGAKATWDSKAGNNVALELASKYRVDPASFAKAKINDRGVAAVAYNTLLRPGLQLGLGVSFDTTKLNEATHKVGSSLTFTA